MINKLKIKGLDHETYYPHHYQEKGIENNEENEYMSNKRRLVIDEILCT